MCKKGFCVNIFKKVFTVSRNVSKQYWKTVIQAVFVARFHNTGISSGHEGSERIC